MSNSLSHTSLHDWFATPLGAYVLERELSFCDDAVVDIFGFNAVQLGTPQVDFLRASRMPLRFALSAENYAPQPGALPLVRGHAGALPVATQSMDLVLLPHVLEFAADPHQILREVDRVMMPEGRLIVMGFNPWSLWGLRQAFGGRGSEHPWSGDFISMVRLKDWLALLGFDVSAGRLACYAPPLANEGWLKRFSFMEKAGDRWWGIAGGIYMMQAIKRVQGMRLITPKWKERRMADKVVVPLSRKSRGDGTHSLPSNVIAWPRKK